MRWLVSIITLCPTLGGMASCAELAANNASGCIGCDSNSANVSVDQTTTFIFIQEGASGSFAKDSSGNYTLTMNDVVPYTVFFADRPARDVGFAPNDKFLKGFSFGDGNPANAAIILPDENETSDMVIVELTNPQYNNTTGTLIYTARELKEYSFESGWFQDQKSKVDASIPERFGRVVLVIDDCACLFFSDSDCPGNCRNSCWSWKHLGCLECGGCCSPGGWTC